MLYNFVLTLKIEAVVKNFAILKGKQLCWGLFLVKLQDCGPATLLKRDSKRGVFRKYCEIFKNIFFEKHLRTAASETHLINTKLLIKILSERF